MQVIYQYLDSAGENGRKELVSIYKFEDLIFPMIYGPFFFLAIVYYLRKSFPQKKYLLLLSLIPVLMVCFDYIENFSLIRIIKAYPNQIPSIATILGKITLTKWILGLISGILVLSSFSIFIRRKYFLKKI